MLMRQNVNNDVSKDLHIVTAKSLFPGHSVEAILF